MSKFELRPGEKVAGMRIPDEAAADWVKTLVESGFSNEEIDELMSRLNPNYAQIKKTGKVKEEIARINRQGQDVNTISDEDAAEWIKLLISEGMSNDQIDYIMSRVNKTYREKMQAAFVNKELQRIKEQTLAKHHHELSPEEEAKIRQGIESRFKK